MRDKNLCLIKIIEKQYSIGLVSGKTSELIASVSKEDYKVDYFEVKDFLFKLSINHENVFEYEVDKSITDQKVIEGIEKIKNDMDYFCQGINNVGIMINDGSMDDLINSLQNSVGVETRRCEICGRDISDRPSHHYLCYECWLETRGY